MKFRLFAFWALIPLTGCTTMALERSTLLQSESSTDLRYKEVLENLAMIAENPATLPAFSSIYAGTADVTDSVASASTLAFTRMALMPFGTTTVFGPEVADLNFARTLKENWTLDPVLVPEKLRAMRCAYWWILFGPERGSSDFNVYLGRYRPPDAKSNFPGDPPGFYFDVADRLAKIQPGWVGVGTRHDVPRGACYQAHCANTYVWVMAGGVEALSEFTVALQGIARVAITSVYFPLPQTRTVKIETTAPDPANPTHQIKEMITVYVDERGYLVPGPGIAAVPLKVRVDNVGTNAELRSQIIAARSP